MSDDVPVIDIENRVEESKQDTESAEQTNNDPPDTPADSSGPSPTSREAVSPAQDSANSQPTATESPTEPDVDESPSSPSEANNTASHTEGTSVEAPPSKPETAEEPSDPTDGDTQSHERKESENNKKDNYHPFYAEVDPQVFSTLVESISALVDECVIKITENNVSVQAQDMSNVAMVEATLDAAGFEDFSGSNQEIGVPLGPLEEMTNLASASDTLELTYEESDESLRIELDGLTYQLALIEPEMIESLDAVPEPPTGVRATITGEGLQQSIDAAEMLESALSMEVTDSDTFSLRANGKTDDFSYDIDSKDNVNVNVNGGEPATEYSEDFLGEMTAAVDRDTPVTLAYQEAYPMELSFSFADATGDIRYFLAPRIQNE